MMRGRKSRGKHNDLEGPMRKPSSVFGFVGVLAISGLIFSAPVYAQEAVETTVHESQSASEASSREPTVLICKYFAPTGTRIKQEFCLTQDDWDDIRENSRTALLRLMRTGTET